MNVGFTGNPITWAALDELMSSDEPPEVVIAVEEGVLTDGVLDYLNRVLPGDSSRRLVVVTGARTHIGDEALLQKYREAMPLMPRQGKGERKRNKADRWR